MQPEQQQDPSQPQTGWQYTSDSSQPAAYPQQPKERPEISWSASEFIAYHKNAGWYIGMLFVILLIAVLIYFITSGDLISSGTTVLIGILFIIYASREPRVLSYHIGNTGVQVGERQIAYNTLRSFAVINEGSFYSIMLLPTQRFMPPVSIYFDRQDESKIIETLGFYLPQEERKQDFIDKLMHIIRF